MIPFKSVIFSILGYGCVVIHPPLLAFLVLDGFVFNIVGFTGNFCTALTMVIKSIWMFLCFAELVKVFNFIAFSACFHKVIVDLVGWIVIFRHFDISRKCLVR